MEGGGLGGKRRGRRGEGGGGGGERGGGGEEGGVRRVEDVGVACLIHRRHLPLSEHEPLPCVAFAVEGLGDGGRDVGFRVQRFGVRAQGQCPAWTLLGAGREFVRKKVCVGERERERVRRAAQPMQRRTKGGQSSAV